MKSYLSFRILIALILAAVSFVSSVASVQAMAPAANVGTALTIEPPTPVSVGNPAEVVIQMISSKGLPVADQPVELFVNNAPERRAKTDASGKITITVRRDEAGAYSLLAVYKGSKFPSLGSSKATSELVVKPALIEIHTTPSLPNVRFSLDDQIFASDAYGVARIEIKKVGTYYLQVLPLEVKDPNLQMEFSRWGDDIFQPGRDIQVPSNKPLQVGFDVSYQVSQSFIDLDNRPVDEKRITSVTLKGSNGTTYTFEDNKPHWLPAGRVIRLNNGLEQSKILYSVISVVIDGSNVVSQAQQRFFVNPNDVWPVKLLLYKANFSAHDALFRFPVGSGIHMEYPDGKVVSFSFNKNQEQSIDGLARGIYHVTVTGAKGYAPATPIALSRDQSVELMVFSYLDMGLIVALGLLLSVGLLLFGRPYIVTQTAALAHRMIPKRRKFQPALIVSSFKAFLARGTQLFLKKKPVPEVAPDSAVEHRMRSEQEGDGVSEEPTDSLIESTSELEQATIMQTAQIESIA